MSEPDDRDQIRARMQDGECIARPVVIHYIGTEYPTAGQQAEMMKHLSEPVEVCMAHLRFLPCRDDGVGHVISNLPEDVIRVAQHRQAVDGDQS